MVITSLPSVVIALSSAVTGKLSRRHPLLLRSRQLSRYVSAGTVDFLFSHTNDEFYFLELNPHLQVEHPTTEMVSPISRTTVSRR